MTGDARPYGDRTKRNAPPGEPEQRTAYDALGTLLGAGEASPSTVGIVLATASVVIMPALSWAERRTGRELGSASVVADSNSR
jgi:divalent metal cation (Fe/Co/Zn/Cd) transporter